MGKNEAEKEMDKQIQKEKAEKQYAESNAFIANALMDGPYAAARKIGLHLEKNYDMEGKGTKGTGFTFRAYAANPDCPVEKSTLHNYWQIYRQHSWLLANNLKPEEYAYSVLLQLPTLRRENGFGDERKLEILQEVKGKTARAAIEHIGQLKGKNTREDQPSVSDLIFLLQNYEARQHLKVSDFEEDDQMRLKDSIAEILKAIGKVQTPLREVTNALEKCLRKDESSTRVDDKTENHENEGQEDGQAAA